MNISVNETYKTCVVIMAGGTGGHIFPGLSTAQALLEHPNITVKWLGAHGLETTLVPKHNIELHSLSIQGLRGKSKLSLITAPFKLLAAIFEARSYLKANKVKCVIGFGGFASAPGAFAAYSLGIPIIIHEQNAVAGLSNRLNAKIAAKVFSAFPCQLANTVVIGNPVRPELAQIPSAENRIKNSSETADSSSRPLKILIIGGSQGARFINRLISETYPLLERPVEIWHQAGGKLFEEARNYWQKSAVTDKAENIKITPFIDDMAAAYTWADLVICRAGALTISELAASGSASILIPFPSAVDDHQTKNAAFLVNAKAALLMPESSLTASDLAPVINTLSLEACIQMATNARSAYLADSAKILSGACLELVNLKSNS